MRRQEVPAVFENVCQVLELVEVFPISVVREVHQLQETFKITFALFDGEVYKVLV